MKHEDLVDKWKYKILRTELFKERVLLSGI